VSKASRRSGRSGAAGNTGATRPQSSDRPASHSAAGSARAGRREQRRTRYDDRSFLERHRGTLITVGALAVVALVVAFVFVGATQKTYACTVIWQPDPTPAPLAGASPRAGYLQPDMGRQHIRPGESARYTYCPPASGDHSSAAGLGPIKPRFYGPDELAPPQGWIHNLEHGALVLLYRCQEGDPCNEATFDQLGEFVATFPDSPICGIPRGQLSPVVARFDEMATPFAALVWGRVLPLETLDTEAVLEFFRLEAERTNPEKQCQAPSPSPSPSPSAGASASPSAPTASPSAPAASPSASPAASASASPAAGASASPSPS
jgi:hypothetical protein